MSGNFDSQINLLTINEDYLTNIGSDIMMKLFHMCSNSEGILMAYYGARSC